MAPSLGALGRAKDISVDSGISKPLTTKTQMPFFGTKTGIMMEFGVRSSRFRFYDTELFVHWRGLYILTVTGVLDAEMKKQHGTRQVSCDTEGGKVTTDYRVLHVRRPVWSLGSMMDSGCDVHFTKIAVGDPKMTGKSSTWSAVAECS